MISDISIQWIGYRKDANRGAIWGWFTITGHPTTPAVQYWRDASNTLKENSCYTLSGRIGKNLQIEHRDLTYEFLKEVDSKKKNFQTREPDKIVGRWGKPFDEELSMFLMMTKLQGIHAY